MHIKRRIQNSCKKSYLYNPLMRKLYVNTNYNLKPFLLFNVNTPMKQINCQNVQKVNFVNKTIINRNLE